MLDDPREAYMRKSVLITPAEQFKLPLAQQQQLYAAIF